MIYEFIRILDEVKPNIFIYENVVGFTQGKMKKSFIEFQKALQGLGYYIKPTILNTKDYGVPQNRPRLYIIGFKNKQEYEQFFFQAPNYTNHKKLKDFLEKDVNNKLYLSDKMLNYIHTKKDKHQSANRLQTGDICCCLNATDYKSPPCIQDNKGVRRLSSRECLNLQDFPKNFKIVCSDTQTYKQAGNAMSINILEMIFNQLKNPKKRDTLF